MTQIRRVSTVLFRHVRRGVMLAPVGADPFVVTAPGDIVWELLAGPMDLDDLVDLLAESFTGDRATIETDVIELVDGLVAAGVLERT